MSQSLKREVLKTFRDLHKARKLVFKGDDVALAAARSRINEEYKSAKRVTNYGSVQELIQYAKDVEKELRSTVIQAREVEPGFYSVRINEDTLKLDNCKPVKT